MKTPDEVLVKQAQQGNERAFEQLVVRYQERIFNVCIRMVGNPPDAEDAALEVFVECYRSLPGFEQRASFSTWLHRIAVRTASRIRRRRRNDAVPAGGMESLTARVVETPECRLREQEIRQAMEDAVDRLGEPLREAVILYFLEGLSQREVADILECSIGTVASRIRLAREHLQRWLKPLIDE